MPPHTPSSLRRRAATLEPKRRFTIVCEGQNTEPDYFRAVQAALRDTLVDLVIEPAAGVPLTIAKRAADIRHRKGKRDSFEEKDEIWAVFDRDDHPNFDEAIRLCNAKNVGVARSNPCFEIWLILHHTDFNRPDGRHAVQAHLQTLDREYDPRRGKRLDCGRLMNQLTTAEQRAERQLTDRHAEGNPFGPPSTTVFQLTRAIALAAAKSRPK